MEKAPTERFRPLDWSMVQLRPTLRSLRQQRGLKLGEVAEKLEVSLTLLHFIEHGKRTLSQARAEKMAEIYGVEPEIVWALYENAIGLLESLD